eukprot:7455749-Pyramimonas_sp.AAC.1
MKYSSEKHDARFIRSSNGHSNPEMIIADLPAPGAPCYFIHGAQWENIPNTVSIGLSCRADDTSNTRGRQFVHGSPCLPGDNRILSGWRVDSEALIMGSLKNLVRDNIPMWLSANDVVMAAGQNGRIPPTHIVQVMGILPSPGCQFNRVGQSGKIEDMYEIRNDASSSRNWFFPNTPYKLKCSDPPPFQEVAFSGVFMIDAYHAGAPAGGSDGSWMQTQGADVA